MKYGYKMPATYALRLCGQPSLPGLSEDGEGQDAKGGIILGVSPKSFSLRGVCLCCEAQETVSK